MMTAEVAASVDAQLGQIAQALPASELKKGRKFASRFFFVLDDTVLSQRKEKFKPKQLEHVDAAIVARTTTYKKEVSPELKAKIEHIREYFLTEIAPLTLATASGARQAQQVVERYIDGKVDTTLLNTFEAMSARAARLKLSLFVLDLFDLDKSFLSELSPHPQGESQDQKLNSILEKILKQVQRQDEGLNILTNQVKRLKPRQFQEDHEEIRVPRAARK